MENVSFWRKVGIYLTGKPQPQTRSELPISRSPNMPINAVNLTGVNNSAVSTDRAMGLTGVYRAVSILSTSVSQLDIGVWRNGEELPLKTTDLVVRPDLDISRAAFLEQTTVSLASNGNAYWLLKGKTNPTGTVAGLLCLNPLDVTVEYTDKGKKTYRYRGKVYQDWQIKQLWLMRLPGYDYGVGPIQSAQNELRGALDLRNYADNWFREGGIPNGILKTDQVLTPDRADEYRDRWDATQANRGTAVVGNGISYQPIYLSPKDAQFIESQQFSLGQIARMFGVPAVAMDLATGDSMTYANRVDVMTDFKTFTLQKYFTEIESALSDLLPRGQEARFKVDTLLRSDQKTRFEGYKTAIESGFLTLNEVRAKEGLLPLEGGDAIRPVSNTNTEGDTNGN